MPHREDNSIDPAIVDHLLSGLESGHAALCLCDPDDQVRYANPVFRAAFFPNAADVPFDFTDALAGAIEAGTGIKLESMGLDQFVARVRERRRAGPARYDFTLDLVDGTWWWVNDHRLPDGWLLVVATEISSIKEEEFRLRAAHAAAMKEAQVDGLTGTRSRKHGLAQAEADLARHLAGGIPFTVAILDIDHFKRINDTRGHMVGDEVLKHFAQALSSRLSSLDHVTRLGGEEFLVTMSSTSEQLGAARIQRLLRTLGPLRASSGHAELAYAFSGGVAAARPSDTVSALMGRADEALYAAKQGGRGKVCVARAPKTDAA